MTAAEIQSPRASELARRWSEIAEIPITEGPQGAPQIELENAAVRFVAPPDSRPEGLGGIDVKVEDRDRLLGAAKERGCYVSDDLVQICGTRFRLVD